MLQNKPLKRSNQLAPLSRDHHDGLLLCWKIREGLKNEVETNRIVMYILHFFKKDLAPHFQQEEEYIFNLLPNGDSMKTEAFAQHESLNEHYRLLKKQDGSNPQLLREFEQLLNDHIRFEERQLFPYIEQNAPPELLAAAGKKIEEMHSQHESAAWHDEFWIKKRS